MALRWTGLLAALVLTAAAVPAAAQTIERMPGGGGGYDVPLSYRVIGRVTPAYQPLRIGPVTRQWPGTYLETAFDGPSAAFRIGPGAVRLRVRIDDAPPIELVRPAPGVYRTAGLGPGPHTLRIDVLSESQEGATTLGGFLLGPDTTPLPLRQRPNQIEFIGDSHTVGYGNTSTSRDCTQEEVWRTTDTAQGIAPRVAARFAADYQVNAISGRGVVRNYAGGAGATLPQAYPFVLFDGGELDRGNYWSPNAIVIALGTNDFSTPLSPNERWSGRDALENDYRETYVRFVQALRERYPHTYFVLWAPDVAGGEVVRATESVVRALRAAGETEIAFVSVGGLDMAGCDYHPSLADNALIADAIAAALVQEEVNPPPPLSAAQWPDARKAAVVPTYSW